VHLLAGGRREVRDIAEVLGISQAAASQHLSVLRSVGLVEARRDGRNVSYELADPDVAQACGLMREVLVRRLRRLGRLGQLATAATSPSLNRPALEGRALEATPR
jgi:DNA-binding transcriptional ArsR family regulator